MAVKTEEIIPNVLGKPKTIVTDPEKFNHEFIVRRTNDGFIFYEVAVTKGSVPSILSGVYSTMTHGVKEVVKYIEKASASKTKDRDSKTAIREERKLTETLVTKAA